VGGKEHTLPATKKKSRDASKKYPTGKMQAHKTSTKKKKQTRESMNKAPGKHPRSKERKTRRQNHTQHGGLAIHYNLVQTVNGALVRIIPSTESERGDCVSVKERSSTMCAFEMFLVTRGIKMEGEGFWQRKEVPQKGGKYSTIRKGRKLG